MSSINIHIEALIQTSSYKDSLSAVFIETLRWIIATD